MAEKAAQAAELTSIDLDDLKVEDSVLKELNDTNADVTRVAPKNSPLESLPPATRPTRPPMAGPDESTRVATPSALESDFEESDSSERVAGHTHFTVVEEDDRRRATHFSQAEEPKSDWTHYFSIAGLSVMLIACVVSVYYFTRPTSASSLHQQIQTAVDSGDDSQLLDAAEAIKELETRFPSDPKNQDYQTLKFDIELLKTSRILQRRARMEGGASNLDPIEQAFLDCVQLRSQSETLAASKVDALLTVFGEKSQLPMAQQKLIELAEHLREQIRKNPFEKNHPAAEQLQDQFRWAVTNLPKELKPKFYQSIIELYSDKAWAREVVASAKLALEGAK